MIKLILMMVGSCMLAGCVGMLAQAPVNANLNWRSDQNARLATTAANAAGEDGSQTVNAEKKNDLATSVTTSSGNAAVGDTTDAK